MKLELQKVRFKNFFSFGANWQEIDLLPGINIILGENGAGKSTMMETISFALFGQVHKKIKKEQIVNWSNKRNCEIQLSFKKDIFNYLVIRGINPDKFQIYRNDILIPRPAHIKDYQKTLEDIIGLNYQTFMSLIHSNINSSEPILSMKTPQKRKFMEKIFGLELYTSLNDKSNNKIKSIKEKEFKDTVSIDLNTRSINDANERISRLKRNILMFKSSKIELNDEIEKLNDIDEDEDNLQEKLNDVNNNIKNYNSKYAYYQLINNNIDNKKNLISFKIKNLKSSIKKLDENEKRDEKLLKDKEKLDNFIKDNGEPEELKNDIENYTQEINDIENDKKMVYNDKLLLINNNSIIEHDINDRKERVKKLDGKSICPLCNQKVLKWGELGNEINIEINELKDRKKNNEEDIGIINSKIKRLESNIGNIKKEIKKIDILIDKIINMKIKVGTNPLNDYKDSKNNFIKKLDRYNKTHNKLDILKDKIDVKKSNINSDITLIEDEEKKLRLKFSEIQSIRKEIKNLKERVELEKSNKMEIEKLIDIDNNTISDLSKNNKNLKEKKVRYSSIIDYLEYIKVICKDENIKQYAISTIIPYLNKRTNFYLSEVGHPFYVVLDNWLDISIKGPGITKGSYGSLSGGESRSVDLSLQLAFLDIVKLRSSVWPDITGFDELLDSSVDSKSINKLMEIIDIKQKDSPESKIFIISHRKEIGEFNSDNTYFIEKKDGYSQIEMKE